MTEPLEQFQAWYDEYDAGRKHDTLIQSTYAQLRAAYYAGYAAREADAQPSKEALEKTRYVPSRQPLPGPPASDYDWTTRRRPPVARMEHAETVWDGQPPVKADPYDEGFGPNGPVRTAAELSERKDGTDSWFLS